MDHHDPQTADMINKAHDVVMFNQSDTLLPKADKLTLEAGSRAIMRVLDGSIGLSDREYDILVFYHNTLPTQERYDLLVKQAHDVRITRYKDAWTQADKKLIRLACEAITQEASAVGEELDRFVNKEEQEIIDADYKLNVPNADASRIATPPRRSLNPQPSSAAQARAAPYRDARPLSGSQSVPHCSTPKPTSLFSFLPQASQGRSAVSTASASPSVVESIAALSDLGSHANKSLSQLPPAVSSKIESFMLNHPKTFPKLDSPAVMRTARGSIPRLQEFPRLPSFNELHFDDLPETVADLDAEMQARIVDHSTLMQYLVNNDALLWKLKMKKNMLVKKPEADI